MWGRLVAVFYVAGYSRQTEYESEKLILYLTSWIYLMLPFGNLLVKRYVTIR